MMSRYKLKTTPVVLDNPCKSYPISRNHLIEISDDERGIAKALAEKFKGQHYHAKVSKTVSPCSDVVILLEGLSHHPNETEAIKSNCQAFLNAKIVAERFANKGGLFITVQDTGGQFGLTSIPPYKAWTGGLAALAKTAKQEWKKATCRAIDIDCANQTAEALAERLFTEIVYGESSLMECGLLSSNERVTLTIEQATAEMVDKFLLKPNSVLVVSGGGRGITAACLVALAKKIKLRLAILGRTALTPKGKNQLSGDDIRQKIITEFQQQSLAFTPRDLNEKMAEIIAQQEIHQTLQCLQEIGTEVSYYSTHVADEKALNQTLTEVRKHYGAIHGIIHGAGIIFDKLITQQTLDQFKQVFDTKVEGFRNLLRATTKDSIQCIGLFSSIVARWGNAGQVAYAMANEVLNKVAQYEAQQRGNACFIKSFNWGPWEEGMVTSEIKQLFQQHDISLLSKEEGCNLFTNELTINQQEVEVLFGSANLSRQPNSLREALTNKTFIKMSDPATQFLLDHHTIQEHRVIPACLVLDWLFRAAKRYFTSFQPLICKNFKVLRGIRFHLDEQYFPEFSIQCKTQNLSSAAPLLHLSLQDQNNKLRYSAVITLAEKEESAFTNLLTEEECLPEASLQASKFYKTEDNDDGLLFHGPALQVVQSLKCISNKGGIGDLIGLHALDWPKEDWQIDVAAFDGVLQLIALGHYHSTQQKVLPTALGSVTVYKPCTHYGPLKCSFEYRVRDKYKILADAILMDNETTPYAIFREIEMHRVSV
jgi:NAD(P)-dependent dehydrogenase (short-subunit alcohol dehydrogenase family)